MFCARHALLGNEHKKPPDCGGGGRGVTDGPNGSAGEEDVLDESFLLVLGDHLYRRGPGTTHACASQLIHAFLEHGEAGKPAIGLKVRAGGGKEVSKPARVSLNSMGLMCAVLYA